MGLIMNKPIPALPAMPDDPQAYGMGLVWLRHGKPILYRKISAFSGAAAIVLCWLALHVGLGIAPASAAAPYLPICVLQGAETTSPYTGFTVRTRGVVYADFDQTTRKGVYIQHVDCDANPFTSDGLFVYLGERVDVAQPGDLVEVSGVLDEYYGMTELQAAPVGVKVLSHNNPLPLAGELAPPFELDAARPYFEARESMRVGLAAGRVVGPTDADGQRWLVSTAAGVERVFAGDPSGGLICAGGDGLFKIDPPVGSGDQVNRLEGALSFRLGSFCLELTAAPQVVPASLPPPVPPGGPGLRLATWNLDELFDASDDPLTEDPLLSNAEYQRRLQKRASALHQALGEPALLAVQEAENRAVLEALVARPEIAAPYSVAWLESADRRGLDVALLYRRDQVEIRRLEARQGCTHLNDGLEPDGNGDPQNPQNWPTCDSNGDGAPDGSRLFSRPPLVAQAVFLAPPAVGQELWLIVNHWKSRVEDTSQVQYTLPRRIEQARFVADLGRELRAAHPGAALVILGDLNDLPGSPPLEALSAAGFADLLPGLPPGERYTYIYQGVSQPLDHIWIDPAGAGVWFALGAARIGADFPTRWEREAESLYRSSDHDPLWVSWLPARARLYLPVALKQ